MEKNMGSDNDHFPDCSWKCAHVQNATSLSNSCCFSLSYACIHFSFFRFLIMQSWLWSPSKSQPTIQSTTRPFLEPLQVNMVSELPLLSVQLSFQTQRWELQVLITLVTWLFVEIKNNKNQKKFNILAVVSLRKAVLALLPRNRKAHNTVCNPQCHQHHVISTEEFCYRQK